MERAYKIIYTVGGVSIVRKSDLQEVFLQGDDEIAFLDEVDVIDNIGSSGALSDAELFNNLCAEYFE